MKGGLAFYVLLCSRLSFTSLELWNDGIVVKRAWSNWAIGQLSTLKNRDHSSLLHEGKPDPSRFKAERRLIYLNKL